MKYNDIFYKDQYVSLVLKEEGKTEQGESYYCDLLDSNNDYITYISKSFVLETIRDLKRCVTDKEVCQYLVECGIVDYYFSKDDICNLDDDILNDLILDWEQVPQDVWEQEIIAHDYINKIGNYYVRCM